MAGASPGLRVVVIIVALWLMSVAVDPDALLRLFRRISYRSALTASLATRLVPVLARDADAHERRRALPAASGRPRSAVARSALAGALDRSVDLAAALELRGYAMAGRPTRRHVPWSRHDMRIAAAGVRHRGGGGGGTDRRGGRRGDLSGARISSSASAELALAAAIVRARRGAVRGARGAHGGGQCLSRSWSRGTSPTAIRSATSRRSRDVSLSLEPGTFTVLAGLSGSGKSTLLQGALRPRAPLPRGPGRGRARGGRAERARARTGRPGRRVRHGAPGPRVPGGDGRRARRAGAAAGARRRDRARR